MKEITIKYNVIILFVIVYFLFLGAFYIGETITIITNNTSDVKFRIIHLFTTGLATIVFLPVLKHIYNKQRQKNNNDAI